MPIQGGVLIGWMTRDEAVTFLCDQCAFDPPLSAEQAEAQWRVYRDAVEGLGERDATGPAELPLDREEERAARRFMTHHRQAPNILRVVKVDPMRLIVKQLMVVTERSDDYRGQCATSQGWLALGLSTTTTNAQIQMRFGLNAMEFDIPHAEYFAAFGPNNQWGLQEGARHVSVTGVQGRMMLWAGYHRSYARVSSMAPDAIDRSLVVALTTDGDFAVSQASPNHGLRDMLCGLRPPLFADFFDDRFFMRVPLRRRRFVLQVRAQVVAVDA